MKRRRNVSNSSIALDRWIVGFVGGSEWRAKRRVRLVWTSMPSLVRFHLALGLGATPFGANASSKSSRTPAFAFNYLLFYCFAVLLLFSFFYFLVYIVLNGCMK